jgi:hypothetical protein
MERLMVVSVFSSLSEALLFRRTGFLFEAHAKEREREVVLKASCDLLKVYHDLVKIGAVATVEEDTLKTEHRGLTSLRWCGFNR